MSMVDLNLGDVPAAVRYKQTPDQIPDSAAFDATVARFYAEAKGYKVKIVSTCFLIFVVCMLLCKLSVDACQILDLVWATWHAMFLE